MTDNFFVSTGMVSVVVSRDDARQVYFPGLDFRFQHWQHTTLNPIVKGYYLFGSAGSTIADSLVPGSVTR